MNRERYIFSTFKKPKNLKLPVNEVGNFASNVRRSLYRQGSLIHVLVRGWFETKATLRTEGKVNESRENKY